MSVCPTCKGQLTWVKKYGKWYCYQCKKYIQAKPTPQQPPSSAAIWFQNAYSIRKKVLTVWNKYWIEDRRGRTLGFAKQKMFRLKEDIRIYTDEKMKQELFRIKQQQILDVWATFAVIDSQTNTTLGFIKRKALASMFVRDEWEVYNAHDQLIGGIYEEKGRGLARKYLPGGALIPEKMTFKLHGVPVAAIDQRFKIIGDIWDLNCMSVPPDFDRRVLLACLLIMGMIERGRK
ncbi:MAG: hypothetical protein LN409_00400 [Candidatus Thermoplasmatota archaeon]|nr:hypothetical protein [Candidatus Thermoplasmatota archaeon]